MKTVNNSQAEDEILARYLCGEMNETEEKAYEQAVAASEANLIKLKMMKKHWSALEGPQESQNPDTPKAWNKLRERLENDKLIPGKSAIGRNRQVPAILRVAAVLLILVSAGAVIYFSTNKGSSPEMVQLTTGSENNTLVKTLGDGSVIYLAQNSLFSFPSEFETGSRNVELKGEAFFDIAPNPEKPFIIETEEASIQVLGTAFNVKTRDGNGFELCVDRGKVKVTSKQEPSHSEFVISGEKISSVKNIFVKTRQTTGDKWYRQRLHFKDESLGNIISVLNRNFNTTFVLADKETGNRKLTVTFGNETVETMTELLCVTLNLKYQTINGSVVLSEKAENTK